MAGSGHRADFIGGDPVVPAIHVFTEAYESHKCATNGRLGASRAGL